MPEGPECQLVADAVKEHCEELFESAEIVENVPGKLHRYSRKPPKNFSELQNKQWILKNAYTKGKLIFFDIEIYKTGKKWVGLSTLGMSGDWRFNSSGHKHARLSFIRERGDLSLVDVRCFGTFRLVTPEEAREAKNKIGWDLLKAPMPEPAWDLLKLNKKIKDKPVGEILLNQNLFSGIGNIYKCETMYEIGINPKHTVSFLPKGTWKKINITAHQILQKAYELEGSSIVDFTANGVEGKAQTVLKIYGKKKCPRGHEVSTIKQGKGSNERTTWYCKKCL